MVITVLMIHLLPWLRAVALLEELEAPALVPALLELSRVIRSGVV